VAATVKVAAVPAVWRLGVGGVMDGGSITVRSGRTEDLACGISCADYTAASSVPASAVAVSPECAGATSFSSAADLTVIDPPSITTQPSSRTNSAGTAATSPSLPAAPNL